MHYSNYCSFIFIPAFAIILFGCSPSAPGVFGKKTPHERYGQQLADAGLRETALYRSWFTHAEKSLRDPLRVTIPYKETGYFSPEAPDAAGLVFSGTRGQKIIISLNKKPVAGFTMYMDLWEQQPLPQETPKLVAASDTSGTAIELEVKTDARYVLRIQPELLAGGEYTLTILTAPSLAFPVPAAKGKVGSIWGDDRDGGIRRHEGIDIFAPFRSPVIAAADGRVTAVNTNNLGGKVIWLRPRSADYTLYYAHLDEQIAVSGQSVKTGDTLGLVGNTGNARNTPSHLHFGIYAYGGAINPLPFVKPVIQGPAAITASLINIGKRARSTGTRISLYEEPGKKSFSSRVLQNNTLIRIDAATTGWYKVTLPDGSKGYLQSGSIANIEKPVRQYSIPAEIPLLETPDSQAPRKSVLSSGTKVSVLASFNDYHYIKSGSEETGWIYTQ